jgi:hypothetical protein
VQGFDAVVPDEVKQHRISRFRANKQQSGEEKNVHYLESF